MFFYSLKTVTSCEVWGYPQNSAQCVEKLHLKILKYIFGVKLSTCNSIDESIVYRELGSYPFSIIVKKQMINFWIRTKAGKGSKLSCVMIAEPCTSNEQYVLHFKVDKLH